jgi:hypothetical protein
MAGGGLLFARYHGLEVLPVVLYGSQTCSPALMEEQKLGCKISGFHDGDYRECRLLGCSAVCLL